MSGVQIGSGRNVSGHKKEILAIAAAAALTAFVYQPSAKALNWDGNLTAPTTGASGGSGIWDFSNTLDWANGTGVTPDIAWPDNATTPTTVATFGGTAGAVTVNTPVSAIQLVFGTNGYTIAAASPTPNILTLGSTASSTIIDAITSVPLTSNVETINTPVKLVASSNNDVIQTNGTIIFGGAITTSSASAIPILAGGNLGTSAAPLLNYMATYVFSANVASGFQIGGGSTNQSANLSQVEWSDSTNPTVDVFGGAGNTIDMAYNASIQVNDVMNIDGALLLNGGTPTNLGDLRVIDPTFNGASSVNVDTTNTSTIAGNATAPLPGHVAFESNNDNDFLINNLTSGAVLTIGTTANEGTATGTVMSLGGTAQNGRILTITGSGSTVINSPMEDANQAAASNNYTNATLAKSGTGTLTINSTGSVYKGATQIQNGTLVLGASNALPTGAVTGTGGTPGAVIFGDVTGNTGTLDLGGNSQTVTSISLSQTSPSALMPSTLAFSATGSPFISITVAGLTVPVSGLAVGEVITDTKTGFSSAITSIEDNGKSSAIIKLSLAADPPSTSGADAYTLSTPATAGGVIGNSSQSSAAALIVNTVANSNALWNIYAGKIVDSVNGGTQPVSVTVGGTSYLSLTGSSNTYSGGTTVNAGSILYANNPGGSATGSGPVSIMGTLGGNGSISGAVSSTAGTVAPGSAASTIGALTLSGGLTTDASSVYTDDVNNAGSSDLIATTNLNLGGGTLNVNVLDTVSGGTYTIATYSGTLTGTFATTNLPPGYGISYGTGTNSSITLSVVPEPASIGLLAMSALGLLGRRRRRAI